jgi:hypothetical protein
MRGQYLAVEYVLFFAFGIAMAVVVFMSFSGIADRVRETGLSTQLETAGEWTRGAIINAFVTASTTNSSIRYNLSIPVKLSACTYAIFVADGWLNLNCTDNYKIGAVLSLYGINVTTVGLIYSSKGFIQISAEPDYVRLD